MNTAILIAALATQGTCVQGVCAPVYHKQAVVAQVVQPVYQNVYYSVGQGIQVEAIVQKQLQKDPGYQAYRKFMAEQMQGKAVGDQDTGKPAAPDRATIADNCASCHSAPAPKANFLLDGTSPVDAASRELAIKAIMTGQMPPKPEGQDGPVLNSLEQFQLIEDLYLISQQE